MILPEFFSREEKDKTQAIEKLIDHSSPRPGFFLMISLAVSMATFGLLLNDVAVIIGSMLIAPLLYPLLSLALGITMTDAKLALRSIYSMCLSIALSIVYSTIISIIYIQTNHNFDTSIIYSYRYFSSYAYVIVALIAGFAATFALVKPQLSETLPGVAISVALIPPLAFVGVGISVFDSFLATQALALFTITMLSVVIASMIVFSLMRFHSKQLVIKKAVAEDEKVVKEEEKSS